MKDKIKEILIDVYQINGRYEDEAAERISRLFSVSKRHLIESILDDVRQSHSEYAVEKIESYLDDGC